MLFGMSISPRMVHLYWYCVGICVELGNITGRRGWTCFSIFLAFERYKRNSTFKDFEISLLLLSGTDALKRENNRLSLTNYQLTAKCKSQRAYKAA